MNAKTIRNVLVATCLLILHTGCRSIFPDASTHRAAALPSELAAVTGFFAANGLKQHVAVYSGFTFPQGHVLHCRVSLDDEHANEVVIQAFFETTIPEEEAQNILRAHNIGDESHLEWTCENSAFVITIAGPAEKFPAALVVLLSSADTLIAEVARIERHCHTPESNPGARKPPGFPRTLPAVPPLSI